MEKNGTILGKFLLSGTNDMMQRLGNPTQNQMGRALQNIFSPMNQDIYNSFADFMVQRVGLAYARQQAFKSPMREFWKQKLYYGSTVTETQLNWIKGHSYDQEAEDQFKQYYPDGLQAFHSINYEQVYPIGVNRDVWRQATADEYGLNNTVAARMQQPINADEYDKTLAVWNLFTAADNHYKLYRHQLTDAPTTEGACKELLQALQQYSYDLQMPTSAYSSTDIPVFARKDELVLFIRSDAMAATNVQALAAVFQLDKADIQYKTHVIPERFWPLNEEDYAILTTSDFFQCYQVDYLTTSQFNAANASTNYWLIDRAIISFSPFVPVVVFSTSAGSEIDTVTLNVTTLEISDANGGEVEAGGTDAITLTLNGTITPEVDTVEVAPDSAVFTVASTSGKTLNSRTYVDKMGVLHVQKSGLVSGDTLQVTAVSTYANPSGETPELKATLDITIK